MLQRGVPETRPSYQVDNHAAYKAILAEEGIDPSVIYFTDTLRNMTRSLFVGFEPTIFTDARWRIAQGFLDAKRLWQRPNDAWDLHMNNALNATYLSDNPSRKNGYPSHLSEVNIRQSARAIQNLAARQDVEERYAASSSEDAKLASGLEIQFAITDRVDNGDIPRGSKSHLLGVTPCPEALYQLRLFENGQYVARIGFNIHIEEDQHVVSVVNIQGAKGSNFTDFEAQHGIPPTNLLVSRLIAMAEQEGMQHMEVRGVYNHRKGNNRLYNKVFDATGVTIRKQG